VVERLPDSATGSDDAKNKSQSTVKCIMLHIASGCPRRRCYDRAINSSKPCVPFLYTQLYWTIHPNYHTL